MWVPSKCMMHCGGLESHKEPTCFKLYFFEGLHEFPSLSNAQTYSLSSNLCGLPLFAGICATIEGIDQPLQWQTKVMGGPSKFLSSFSFA
jgi:hypothetical protein